VLTKRKFLKCETLWARMKSNNYMLGGTVEEAEVNLPTHKAEGMILGKGEMALLKDRGKAPI
jgi:hypothetical protein